MRRWRRSPRRAPRQRGGTGRVVFVTGEPGIGKTSLVTRFLRDLDAGARVLVGTCDDLSIPRPLGPDPRPRRRRVAGARGGARRRRRAARDPEPADRGARDRRRGRRCSCSRTCTGPTTRRSTRSRSSGAGSGRCRRCSSSPSAAARRRRATRSHAAVGAIRADDSVVIELDAALGARGRRRSPATTPTRSTRRRAATRSTSPSCSRSRASAELPPSVANAVLGRASRLDDDARRAGRARLRRAEPRRARRCSTP